VVQQTQIDSEMTLPARPRAARPPPLNIRHDGGGAGRRQTRLLSSFDDMSPPTPGVDDTPYIRFAIEQLTRDEDVMGHGRYSLLTSDDYPIQRILPHDGTGVHGPAAPRFPVPSPTPPLEDEPAPSMPKRISRKPVPDEVLIPVDVVDDQRELGFVPTPLRLPALVLYLILCLLVLAGLLFSLVFASDRHGLFDYDGTTTPRYFVFQYLPQLLGMILLIWLFVIEAAVYRVIPYFGMTAPRPYDRVLQDVRILPANFVLPDLRFFGAGEPLLGVTFLMFWLANATIPLLASLYQTQWITDDGPARWRWTTVRGVGWTLFALYLLLAAGVLYCMIRFRRRQSALLWDPDSLADVICLFQKSNLCHDFERTEVSPNVGSHIPPKFLRLGYWTTSQRSDVFHAVGEEHAVIHRLSMDAVPETEKPDGPTGSASADVERQRSSYASSFSRNIHSPFVRYRWTPWFLRDSAVLAWIIMAIILIIAFLVVSFVNQAVQRGFRPLLPSRTGPGGFSPANFLYSFLPTLLGMFLFLAWQPIDTYFRAIQPFANLSNPAGARAERTLLLSYPAGFPGRVTAQAIMNGDYKVAYISFVSLMALTIPVLAGGVFTAQLFTSDNEVRMVASMPGYIALCVFLTVYALSYITIWPTRKRYLPHNINTLANLMSFLYASPLFGDGAFRNVNSKADLVDRLVGASAGLTAETRDPKPSARFAFGIYMGRDGREHLGIDRLQRPGSGEMLVTPGLRR